LTQAASVSNCQWILAWCWLRWPCHCYLSKLLRQPTRFELKNTASGEFMFNLKAGNGETILTSERYTSKQGALNGIESDVPD